MRKCRQIIDMPIESLLATTVKRESRRTYRRAIRLAFGAGGFRYLFERFAECNRSLTYRDLAKMFGISGGEIHRLLKFKRRLDAGTLVMLLFSTRINRRRLVEALTKDSGRRIRTACFSRAVEMTAQLLKEIPADANKEAVVLEDDAALLLAAMELLPLERLTRGKLTMEVKDRNLLGRIVKRACRYTPRAAGNPEILFHTEPAEYLQNLLTRYGYAALVAYVALQDMWAGKPPASQKKISTKRQKLKSANGLVTANFGTRISEAIFSRNM